MKKHFVSQYQKLKILICFSVLPVFCCLATHRVTAQIKAGVAKIDITDRSAGLVNDPLFVKALVLDDGTTRMAIITLDVVAIAEIGSVKNEYLAEVRTAIQTQLNIQPTNVLINSSHCHGKVRDDVAQLTIDAVKEAARLLVPVTVGMAVGHEDRIMENRRFKLKNGMQADMRRAYAMPPDEQVAEIGPVDPQIGILRLNRKNGKTLAVIYNFAVHPIQGVPNGGNTADIIGFASKVIEENLNEGALALFLQGCGGDINPVAYKNPETPPDAEKLGNMLGLSTMRALKNIKEQPSGKIKIINEKVDFPRVNFEERIKRLKDYQLKLVGDLRGTNMNFKSFLPALIKHNYSPAHPSYHMQAYLRDESLGKNDWARLDSVNRQEVDAYRKNIYIMEELTRINENLSLMTKHQAASAGRTTVNAEIVGLKIGDFALVTYPGELTVQIGLNIKQKSRHPNTFVAGYTNGYLYYAPTADQLNNSGVGQEDCETILAPEWQKQYEGKVLEILKML